MHFYSLNFHYFCMSKINFSHVSIILFIGNHIFIDHFHFLSSLVMTLPSLSQPAEAFKKNMLANLCSTQYFHLPPILSLLSYHYFHLSHIITFTFLTTIFTFLDHHFYFLHDQVRAETGGPLAYVAIAGNCAGAVSVGDCVAAMLLQVHFQTHHFCLFNLHLKNLIFICSCRGPLGWVAM